MGPGLVSNAQEVDNTLKVWAVKLQSATLDHYRAAVWAVFCKLVDTTPQFSGRAAANWKIGVGAPDLTFDEDVGEKFTGKFAEFDRTRHVGDQKWTKHAKDTNRHKLRLIKSLTEVYITNSTRGDTDKGRSGEYYLTSLQSPDYWYQKLRVDNLGAERVDDVIASESWREYLHKNLVDKEFFK